MYCVVGFIGFEIHEPVTQSNYNFLY